MVNRWVMIQALLGGTETMRSQGETFLPKYERESDTHWDQRISRAVLTNMVELTSDHLTGQALKVPPQPDEDVPEQIVELLEDVDGQGTALPTFARGVFKEAVDKAFTHVLVDMPSLAPNEDGSARTMEQDRSEGIRPHWIHIPPENMIFMHSVTENGKEVLTQIRFKEDIVEVVGWEEQVKERIRVMMRGMDEDGNFVTAWQLWEKIEVSKNKYEWRLTDEGTMDIDEIPLVTFYTAKDGLSYGKPPLLDLAYLNVAHWQSGSDQRNILTVTRFPLLAASGALVEDDTGDGPVSVGPHSFLHMPDPQGKFYYVEHQGQAISAGREDLKDLEEQMASYGAEFLKKRPANEGVTARVLDTSESLSSLQVWAIDFKDALENCLMLTAKWLGIENAAGGSILLDSDEIGLSEADSSHLDTLTKARAARDISRKAYLEELKRRRVLSEDFDIDDDDALLESEAPSPEMSAMFGPGSDNEQEDDDENEDDAAIQE